MEKGFLKYLEHVPDTMDTFMRYYEYWWECTLALQEMKQSICGDIDIVLINETEDLKRNLDQDMREIFGQFLEAAEGYGIIPGTYEEEISTVINYLEQNYYSQLEKEE